MHEAMWYFQRDYSISSVLPSPVTLIHECEIIADLSGPGDFSKVR